MGDQRPLEAASAITAADIPHAPFVFFENAPAFGLTNGVVSVTISANRTMIGPGGAVINDQVVTAYLRGNVPAMLSLKAAIDSALLLAAPTQGAQN